MQNRAKIGGILSIIAGIFGILGMLGLISMALFFTVMSSSLSSSLDASEAMPTEFIAFLWIVYGGMGVVLGLIGVFGIIGGVFALKKRNWGLALAGSIAGTLTFLPLGIPAIIYTSLAQSEFAPAGTAAIPYNVSESGSVLQTKAKISGILSIVSGGFSIVVMAFYFLMALFYRSMFSPFFSMFPYDDAAADEFFTVFNRAMNWGLVFYQGIGVAFGLLGIVAIIGGIYALRRECWGLALTGTIAGAVTFFPTGLPALIYAVSAQPEFKPANGTVSSAAPTPPTV